MKPINKLKSWWRNRRRRIAAAKLANAALREFVYLDEVSVYSLTASRLGPIAVEFTDTETRTLGSEVEGSVEASIGVGKATSRGKTSTSREQSGQVLRKSIVQTTFKDMHDREADHLAISPKRDSPPKVTSVDGLFDLTPDRAYVVDPAALKRGELVELEVELETHAVFRFNAVVTAYLDILHEDLEVFGVALPAEAQVRAIHRILDRLLTGLVPLRGLAVDYVVLKHRDRELVVHRDVVGQLTDVDHLVSTPLVVVGVAEQHLFWKDIRRVLFSDSRYRLFCRISESGLRDHWTPVKLTDVLKVVAPQFENQLLTALGESTLAAMGEAATAAPGDEGPQEKLHQAALSFAQHLAAFHKTTIDAQGIGDVVTGLVKSGASLGTIDESRKFYRAIQAAVDGQLDVTTSSDVAARCRAIATTEIGLGIGGTLSPSPPSPVLLTAPTDERFLDTELVAIYW